jgi:signal transduction histidine kinase
VYLQRLPASVVLTVEDNGEGFEAGSSRRRQQEGLGLLGIEERVTDARGTFRLESAQGRGTRITVELPAMTASRDQAGPGEGADDAGSAREGDAR